VKNKEFIQALLDDKKIQWRPVMDFRSGRRLNEGWIDFDTPKNALYYLADEGHEFRIKPKEDIVRYGVVYVGDGARQWGFSTIEKASMTCTPTGKYRIVKRVFDGETGKEKSLEFVNGS
jgi:hypothetical protein